jgi:hypothetical protein
MRSCFFTQEETTRHKPSKTSCVPGDDSSDYSSRLQPRPHFIEIKEIEQTCKTDPLLSGATLERINYGKANDLSVRITMPDGEKSEFYSSGNSVTGTLGGLHNRPKLPLND